jgi:NAD(P)-dependent dehydrogenase (short-subunit alcohol dehydrogenase family)
MALNPPLRDWAGLPVWIVGGSTGIGRALAQRLHAAGAQVTVSARSAPALNDLAQAHPGLHALPLDVTRSADLQAAVQQVQTTTGLHLVVYCVGHYQPLSANAFDADAVMRHMHLNYGSAVQWLEAVLPPLLAQGQGHISLVSSVAGFRGLPKSLGYGPSKAALTHLAEVLHLDLRPQGLGVSVVHPGFVRTPLTAQNDFHMPALIEPEQAAQAMVDQWAQGQFELHFPKRFTRFMKCLRVLPYRWYLPLAARLTQKDTRA